MLLAGVGNNVFTTATEAKQYMAAAVYNFFITIINCAAIHAYCASLLLCIFCAYISYYIPILYVTVLVQYTAQRYFHLVGLAP